MKPLNLTRRTKTILTLDLVLTLVLALLEWRHPWLTAWWRS